MLKVFLIIYALYVFKIHSKNNKKYGGYQDWTCNLLHAKRVLCQSAIEPVESYGLKILFDSFYIYASSHVNSLSAVVTVIVRIYTVLIFVFNVTILLVVLSNYSSLAYSRVQIANHGETVNCSFKFV